MKREKNYKTAKFIEALEHIDPKYVEEAGKKIKERQTGQTVASMSRAKSLRQVLALVACVLLLSAVIPAVTYLVGHLPDILGSSTGDDTTEQTSPETPPEETSSPAPETTVTETMIEETTAEETTSEPETTECTHSEYICTENMPTCTESAIIEYGCMRCGYSWSKTEPPLGHDFKDGVCTRCGEKEPITDGSQGLEYRIIGDHAEVTGIGTCTDTEIVIPSYYSGYPVTQINIWAFKDNIRITSVKISDTVAMIAGNAFSGCTALNSIYISASVIDVTALSFDGCTNITSITVDPNNPYYEGTNCIIQKSNKWLLLGCRTTVIPSDGSVEYIGGCSFNGISGLYSITVPEGVIDIDTSAFNNCPDLRELHLPSTLRSASGGESNIISGCNNIEVITIPKNSEYFYVDGNCLIERKTGTLILGCKTSVIPTDGSVKAIGTHAFQGNLSLRDVVLPEGITSIGEGAFASCRNLKSIVFPKSLTKIGAWAFENCSSLEKINIPENVTLISYGAFRACTKLTEAALPRSLKELSWDSFGQCTALKEIRFTGTKKEWNSITKDNSWYYGSSINAIRCSDGDVNLNEYDGSRGLEYRIEGDHAVLVGIGTCTDKEIIVASTYNGLPVTSVDYSFSKISNVTSITLSDSVLTVGGIDNMPDLVKVYFSKSVEGINPESLIGCPNLVVIEVDKENQRYMSAGNCLIEKATKTIVHGCKGSVIPSDGSVTVIGEFSFHGCDWLTELTIPEGIERIDAYAFAGCDSLRRVILSDSLTYLGFGAFCLCESLESISLGNSLETLGGSVFEDCPKLMELTLPKTIKLLCGLAFFECKSLKKVSYEGTIAEWRAIEKTAMWSDGAAFTVIHCSDGDAELIEYDGSRGLEYKIVGDHALLIGIGTCTDKNIVVATKYNGLPVTEIDDFAFENVGGFTSITVSEGITSIGLDAFSSCPDLREIYLPTTLESISGGEGIAFYGCNALEIISVAAGNPKYISVGNCLIERESKILAAGCKNSKIPTDGSVTVIGYFAFHGIDTLKNIVIPEGVTEILGYAFAGCGGLESITLPNSLTSLGDRAFGSCVSLESITLSDNVTFLGGGVFSGCTSLKDVRLPARVEYLGEETFAGCAIEGIVIPKGVTDLSGGMFTNCTKLKSVTFLDRVEDLGMYTFYRCTSLTEFNVPEGVKIIGQYAFEDCANLIRITLPASVEKIERNAFSGCSRLTNFRYAGTKAEWAALKKSDTWNKGCPFTVIHCSDGDVELYDTNGSQGLEYWVSDDGRSAFLVGIGTCTDKDIIIASTYNGVPVTEILPSAFRNNGNIRSVRISDSVEVIGYEAFSGCKALESIYIGAGLREIGFEAFVGNSVLSNITVDAKNPYFSGNGYCIVEKSTKTLILGCSHTVIPTDGSVKKIGINAFRDNELFSTITIPVGVTEIGSYAFEGCTNLVFVYLPEGLTTVGTDVFKGCTRLQSIDIPESLTVIALSMFEGCSNLRSVSGGEGVTLIEAKAFEGCTKLEAFTCANKLTQIDSLAFKYCVNLKSIDIPASVTEIGQEVFSGCTALESVTVRGNVQSLYGGVFSNCSSLKTVNLRGSVGSISDYAFKYCTSLERITLPEGTKIGRGAFYECTALESINIPRGGTEIGDEAFSGCTSLTAIIIPEGITKIHLEAFYRCKNLASVMLPSTLTKIGSWAFAECESLKSIVIPDSVVWVSDRAFSDCRSLSSVKFGKNVELIMENAFLYCTSLKSVTLPGSLIELCNGAFAGCSGLEDVTFEKGIERLGFYIFSDCLKLDEISFTGSIAEWDNVFVPEEAFGNIEIKRIKCADGVIDNSDPEIPSLEYKLAPDGRSARVVGIGGIADSDIVIDATYLGVPVTEIADNAFFGCSAVKSVIIPESVTKIGAHAFSLCTSLESIVLPDGVTSIGEYAFHACENLKTADLGESVVSIGSNAFFACRRLESIDLGEKLQTIGDSAFFECVSLKSLTLPKTLKSIGAMAFSECKSIESVTYNGTAAEWKKIALDEMWAFESSIALVKCSDGDVKK